MWELLLVGSLICGALGGYLTVALKNKADRVRIINAETEIEALSERLSRREKREAGKKGVEAREEEKNLELWAREHAPQGFGVQAGTHGGHKFHPGFSA